MAAVMSPFVVIIKYRPVEAQLCKLVAICGCHGETQVLYQELVGSGRYSVYSTAMRIPRFFTVVHHVVLNGCWQRVPLSVSEHDAEILSSTPSLTMKSTPCGVEFAEPVPGVGMIELMLDIAESKSVSVSLLQFELVR